MRLIDSHCHLQSDRFSEDVEAVLERATDVGVERMLVPGWDRDSSKAALDLVQRHPSLDAAVGIHPHDAARASADDWQTIQAWARDERVVAIGETGLDYDRVFSPIKDQLDNLRRHLALSAELGKPAILHCRSATGRRDAQDALLEALVSVGLRGPAATSGSGGRPPAVIHSFSGPVDYARAVLDLGLAISISGLAFRNGEEPTAAVAGIVPADRLLVETDAPFLAPPGAPKGRNAPEWVRITAAQVAKWRNVHPDELGLDLVGAYDRTFGGN